MKTKLLALLILGLVGCDVPGIIQIKNSLPEEIEVSFQLKIKKQVYWLIRIRLNQTKKYIKH